MTNFSANGIACCYAQFKVPLPIELNVTVYPELAKGSLTATLWTYLNINRMERRLNGLSRFAMILFAFILTIIIIYIRYIFFQNHFKQFLTY